MVRKKVKSDKISSPQSKERVKESKKVITFIPNGTKIKWDKIKGMEGNIVRFKMDDPERQEYLKNKTYEHLYVGIDGDDLYTYYNIK
jgi:hypothetical protein